MNQQQLADILNQSSNFHRAQDLHNAFAQEGPFKIPKELTRQEIRNIAIWRMGTSHENPAQIASVDEQYCRIVTRAALEFRHTNFEIETTGRIRLMRCIDGVSLSIATAILAILEPDRHCVLNGRSWKQLHILNHLKETAPTRFDSEKQYFLFREALLKFATEVGNGWTAFNLDRALWAQDRLEEKQHAVASEDPLKHKEE